MNDDRRRNTILELGRIREPLHATGFGLGALLAGVHLWLGTETGLTTFYVVGAVYVAGLAVYLTTYWRPVGYLVAIVHTLALGVVWLLGGRAFFDVGVATGVLALSFVVVSGYLFAADSGLTAAAHGP
ncbi:hypothetical protein AUR64_12550 [Haloprofundus marisrubri]|uniref:Uncharacterized protein n=1 Tax=Haloprofundus marisrubri TaxID=1514971 RepID=A0A0W1RAH5_9EURY|nr:hypothetical protein [Haloprofundus marisrubri]KTG10391.1 hypothetical protein AUR64_12550 [Haloprofundus marisrubri]